MAVKRGKAETCSEIAIGAASAGAKSPSHSSGIRTMQCWRVTSKPEAICWSYLNIGSLVLLAILN